MVIILSGFQTPTRPGAIHLARRAIKHTQAQDLVEIRRLVLPKYLTGGYLDD